jgi:competence transcription factor ComK
MVLNSHYIKCITEIGKNELDVMFHDGDSIILHESFKTISDQIITDAIADYLNSYVNICKEEL